MNRLFGLNSKDPRNYAVLIKDYTEDPIKITRPSEVGLVNYRHENSYYNIGEGNNCFRIRQWHYPTSYMGLYFPDKHAENMVEYTRNVSHPVGNYELEEIIENLNNQEELKITKTKLSIDANKLKVKIFSESEIDFTAPNSIASVLGFRNKVLKAHVEHFSDFPPALFQLKTIFVHCHLVNTNIMDEDTHSDIIYSFQMDYAKNGTSTIKEPQTILYYPFTETELTQLRIDIKDQDGNHVKFQEPASVGLSIRPISY